MKKHNYKHYAKVKPNNIRKIEYWIRTGQCGLHKVDFSPTLKTERGRFAEKKRAFREISEAF